MDSLKDKTRKGLIWSLFNQFGKQGISFLATILLVRLLTPSDFGLLAMVLVVTSFSTKLINFGFGTAIVQNNQLNQKDISSVFWFNIVLGLILTIIIYSIAVPLSAFYKEPRLVPITQALSIIYVLISGLLVPRALLEKELNFQAIAIVETIGTFSSSLLAIILATKGYGVWALVAQVISIQVVSLILYLLLSRWHPSFTFQFHSIKKLGRFSLSVFYSSTLFYLAANIDRFLIGKKIGKMDVGLYDKSYTLAGMPKRNMSQIILSVLFASFSKIQNDHEKVKTIFLKAMKYVALINFPMMVGLLISTKSFVSTVFGSQWHPVIPYLRIFSMVILLDSFSTLLGSVLLARGLSKTIIQDATLRQGIVIVSAFVGLHWGSLGVAAGILVASILNFVLTLHHTKKATYIAPKSQLQNVKTIFFAAITMGFIIYLLQSYTTETLPEFWVLILNLLVGMISYFGLLYWKKDQTIAHFTQLIIKQK